MVIDASEDVKLSVKGLQSWSRYCAQAMVVPKSYTNVKQFSAAVCVTNTPGKCVFTCASKYFRQPCNSSTKQLLHYFLFNKKKIEYSQYSIL